MWLDLPTYPRAHLEVAGEYAAVGRDEDVDCIAPAAGFSRRACGSLEVVFETQISLRAQTEEAEVPVAADPLDDVAGQVDDVDLIQDTFEAGKQRVAGRASKGLRRATAKTGRRGGGGRVLLPGGGAGFPTVRPWAGRRRWQWRGDQPASVRSEGPIRLIL